jgi:hypothetical protein
MPVQSIRMKPRRNKRWRYQDVWLECGHLRHQTIHSFQRVHFGVEIGVFATAVRAFDV